MKNRYSVSYFLIISILTIMLTMAYSFTYNQQQSQYLANLEEGHGSSINSNSNEIISSGFYLRQQGEYVIVYLYDNETIFEETNILISELSEDLQHDIIGGLYIESTQELYGFLENYSS